MKCAYWILTSMVYLSPLAQTMAHAADWRECASITEDSARLACYDKLAKVEPTHAVPTDHVQNPVAPDNNSSAPVPQAKALNERIDQEKQGNSNVFLIRAYKPNYLLPITYTTNRLDNPVYDFKPQQVESKFQLSFQFNWWDHPLGTDSRFYFAYTQLSLWQTYNTESAPFRETNYEPEAGLDVTVNRDFMGLNFRKVRASFIHQSNGQGGCVHAAGTVWRCKRRLAEAISPGHYVVGTGFLNPGKPMTIQISPTTWDTAI